MDSKYKDVSLVPFYECEDGSLESWWFIVVYKDGRRYRAQVKITGEPESKEDHETRN